MKKFMLLGTVAVLALAALVYASFQVYHLLPAQETPMVFWFWVPAVLILSVSVTSLERVGPKKLLFLYVGIFSSIITGALAGRSIGDVWGLFMGAAAGAIVVICSYVTGESFIGEDVASTLYGIAGLVIVAITGAISGIMGSRDFGKVWPYCLLLFTAMAVSYGVAYGIGLMRDAKRILPRYRLE